MAELVKALDLKSNGFSRVGSNPAGVDKPVFFCVVVVTIHRSGQRAARMVIGPGPCAHGHRARPGVATRTRRCNHMASCTFRLQPPVHYQQPGGVVCNSVDAVDLQSPLQTHSALQWSGACLLPRYILSAFLQQFTWILKQELRNSIVS